MSNTEHWYSDAEYQQALSLADVRGVVLLESPCTWCGIEAGRHRTSHLRWHLDCDAMRWFFGRNAPMRCTVR